MTNDEASNIADDLIRVIEDCLSAYERGRGAANDQAAKNAIQHIRNCFTDRAALLDLCKPMHGWGFPGLEAALRHQEERK